MSIGRRGHVAMVGRNTRSFTYPTAKKSQGVMSGDPGAHSIRGWSFPGARPIQRSGKTVFGYIALRLKLEQKPEQILVNVNIKHVMSTRSSGLEFLCTESHTA